MGRHLAGPDSVSPVRPDDCPVGQRVRAGRVHSVDGLLQGFGELPEFEPDFLGSGTALSGWKAWG